MLLFNNTLIYSQCKCRPASLITSFLILFYFHIFYDVHNLFCPFFPHFLVSISASHQEFRNCYLDSQIQRITKAIGMGLLHPVRNSPFCDSKLYCQFCNLTHAGQKSPESELKLPYEQSMQIRSKN